MKKSKGENTKDMGRKQQWMEAWGEGWVWDSVEVTGTASG